MFIAPDHARSVRRWRRTGAGLWTEVGHTVIGTAGNRAIELLIAMLVAACGTLGMFSWLDLRSRRERQARFDAAAPLADVIAAALSLPGKAPCVKPYLSGAWTLVEGRGWGVELIVGAGWVRLSIPLEPGAGGARWDLVRASELGYGGLAQDPADPYRALPEDVLGPGWMARGEGAEARSRAVPDRLKEFLRGPEGAGACVQRGRLCVGLTSSSGREVADWVRRMRELVPEP